MPISRLNSLVLSLVGIALLACTSSRGDLAADHEALLRLHEEQRTAHLERNAALLTGSFADTFYSINRGRVSTPSRAASTERFQAYFDQSTFRVWDDLVQPIIRISPDGQMAYVIVQKRVGLQPADSAQGPGEDTLYAWLATYEKRGGHWRLTGLASTDRQE